MSGQPIVWPTYVKRQCDRLGNSIGINVLYGIPEARMKTTWRTIFGLLLFVLFSNVVLADKGIVVLYLAGCRSYFIADGPRGYYLLEWYGGYDPSKGDVIVGDIGSYGFKDVYYPNQGREGRVYVDDYLLSKDRAIEKYREKCQ